MGTRNPDWWQAASPYLDQALDLPEAERAQWLESLHRENPTIAELVGRLLDEHSVLAEEGFLERSAPSLPPGPAVAGQTVGVYTLVSPIGEGGMGTVWLARRSDGRFERQVAIKFLGIAVRGRLSEERFKQEGRILGRLAHPHIAELLDAGVSKAGQPYLVLEYVDGEHIDRYCDQRSLDVSARIGLILDVIEAVAHAHANLIVHRDLKPSNVLVKSAHRPGLPPEMPGTGLQQADPARGVGEFPGSDGQVKLLDFGIAKLLEAGEQPGAPTLLTREGGGALTLACAAPEQVTGGVVTTATDVYALGVLLYLLLTGRHPTGDGPHSPAGLMKAIVEDDPPRMSETILALLPETAHANAARRSTTAEKLRRLLRGDLDTIVVKALKKDPRERYSSVTALGDDLRRHLRHEPIAARPDTVGYRTARFIRRNRAVVALAALAVTASLAGVMGTLLQARTARAQRDFAVRQLSRAEEINYLNAFLLSDAAPMGKPFTVNDLLVRAERLVARQTGANPATRVEMLVSIGNQYATLDEDVSARRVLEQAYQLSRSLQEPSTRARAACGLANILSRGSELSHAESLVQEGLRQLPAEPMFALDRASCLHFGSKVSREENATKQAVERLRATQQALQEAPYHSAVADLTALLDLAETYRIAGQFREAITTSEQAAALMTSLGRDDTQRAGTLFNNWALTLNLAGRTLEAEKIYRRAIQIGSSDSNEGSISPMLLLNYGRVLSDLGRFREADSYVRRASAAARQSGTQHVVAQSLVVQASIYRGLGDAKSASKAIDELDPLYRRLYPPGHRAFASITSQRSLNARLSGDLTSALELANQALSLMDSMMQAGRGGGDLLPILLVRRSDVEILLHNFEAAAADAQRALALLQKDAQPGAFSSSFGQAYLSLGRALHARDKSEEARAAFRSAAQHLANAVGPDHPDTLAARQLVEQAPK